MNEPTLRARAIEPDRSLPQRPFARFHRCLTGGRFLRRHPALAGAMIAATALAACGAPASPASAFVPAVETGRPVSLMVTEQDIYPGQFVAEKDVAISARVSGYLDKIFFEDGDLVAEGEVLFRLGQRPFQAEVARREALLRQAESTLLLAGVELERSEVLIAASAAPEEELDQRRADVELAEAAVLAARSELRLAQIDLENTEVRAPFAGRVSDSRRDVGALVEGGNAQATVLTTLASVDPIEFVFDASEADFLRYVRLGGAGERESSRDRETPVSVSLSDDEGWVHEGYINFLDNRLDDRSGTIRARARFENSEGTLIPGLFGRVRLPGRGPYAALAVPDTAILTDQITKIVYIVDTDGKVSARPVEIGQLEGDLRVVESGVIETDMIVLSGLMQIRPGMTVDPRPAAASSEPPVTAPAQAAQ